MNERCGQRESQGSKIWFSWTAQEIENQTRTEEASRIFCNNKNLHFKYLHNVWRVFLSWSSWMWKLRSMYACQNVLWNPGRQDVSLLALRAGCKHSLAFSPCLLLSQLRLGSCADSRCLILEKWNSFLNNTHIKVTYKKHATCIQNLMETLRAVPLFRNAWRAGVGAQWKGVAQGPIFNTVMWLLILRAARLEREGFFFLQKLFQKWIRVTSRFANTNWKKTKRRSILANTNRAVTSVL